jgi:hypothetical protein
MFLELGLDQGQASVLADEIDGRPLDALRVRCDGVRWTSHNRFGVTIWDVPILLEEGRFAYVEYGTAWNPLGAADRACLLERSGVDWRLVGCITTSVS